MSSTRSSRSVNAPNALAIERASSAALGPGMSAALRMLCDAAYNADMGPNLRDIGPGEHLLGLVNGVLVSHLMWVTRWLQPGESPPLRTAYVEMVATAPHAQRRGYASALLEYFVPQVGDYQLAALSPATPNLYARLGWTFWRGSLTVRHETRVLPAPEERVMILPLLLTPALDLDLPLSIEWRPGEVW
jgi:GNAT superfamily N-acetyltransferase